MKTRKIPFATPAFTAVLMLLVVTCAGASWVGSDNLSNNISAVNWTIDQEHEGVMQIMGTNGHASFIVPTATGSEQNAYLLWKGTPPTTNDWIADIFGQNAGPSGSKIKISVSDTATLGTNGLTATTNRQALDLRMTGTTFSTVSWPGLTLGNSIARASVAATNSNFGLRLVHRGGTHGTVEAWYDPTATKANWTLLDVMSMADFSPGMAPTDSFTIGIMGQSDNGGPVVEGQLWVDNFNITTLPLQVTTTNLPNGTNGVAYNQTLAAAGGQLPYSWSLFSGTMPPGLTLASDGVISGTPTNSGPFSFIVQVTDALSGIAMQSVALTVIGTPIVSIIQPRDNPITVPVGSNVTFAVSVSGIGPFSFQWQLSETNIPDGIITTVAGNGTSGYSGDGVAAINSNLSYPSGLAVDATGNLFIADSGNNVIRKVGTSGIISTVAGNGNYNYSGDGSEATNAEFSGPAAVAVDAAGNLFIADSVNNVIREVGTNGIISTVAGNGYGAGTGIGYYLGDGHPATNAELNGPFGVAVDATGNLFIADLGNNVIRKVGTNGIIITVAGNGYTYNNFGGYSGDGGPATNAELNGPIGVAVDTTGNLFIADYYNQRIREVGTNGIITTVAGNGYEYNGFGGYSGDGGAATNAELNGPSGVAVDITGNLCIADYSNQRIREVGTNGIITTVAGNGYIYNFYGGYFGDEGAATNAELNNPSDVAIDATGNLFIADKYNQRIREVINPYIPGPTLLLYDVGFGNAGPYDVVVANRYGSVTSTIVNLTVIVPLQITTTSLPNGTNGLAYTQQLFSTYGQSPYSWAITSGILPSGLVLTTNGLISGTPTNNGTNSFTVEVTDALSETATLALALAVLGPPSVAIQATNNSVAVAVGTNVSLTVSVVGIGPFSYQWQLNRTNLPTSIIITVAGNGTNGFSGDGGTATNAELYKPFRVAVDTVGNLFIADSDNNCIRKVATNGTITTVAGTGILGYSGDGRTATNAELNFPTGVAVDITSSLFIADLDNNCIRKVGTNGIITTVAGNGTIGYSGDGRMATNAELNNPADVAVDTTGNLFIADSLNCCIRKVATNGIISTVAGNGTFGYSGDGGSATNAEFYEPFGVTVDTNGNVFIADSINNVIRKVGTNGIISTVAGNGTNGFSGDGGTATNAEFFYPWSVSVDAVGNLFIADSDNNCIREVGTNGIITTVAGNSNGYGAGGYSGDGGPAINAELNYPRDVAVDTTGNLFIADSGNNRIRKVFGAGFSAIGPTLVLNDVGFGNAGAYDVVVSNPYGSVTSSIVNITVTLPSIIISAPKITLAKTNFTFQVSGPPGSNYILQESTNLLNWSSNSAFTIPVTGTINLTNTISGFNSRFYRVMIP